MVKYIIVGLRIERDLLTKCTGDNCDFTYYKEMGDIYIILLKCDGALYELKMYEEEGECGSGWTTASYGRSSMKNVSHFAGKTHVPISQDKIELSSGYGGIEDTENLYFNFSEDGDDHYYPRGYVNVHMDQFKILNEYRILDARPIWIITGDCPEMKNLLSTFDDDLSICYTEREKKLPNEITDSIIVVGNNHTLEDVEQCISDSDNCCIIYIHFTVGDEIDRLQMEIDHTKYMPPPQTDVETSSVSAQPVVENDNNNVKPCFIFKGPSLTGKSYLSAKLSNDFSVYETDQNEDLPEKITESIIVVGCKYNHQLKEIEQRADPHIRSNFIYVYFSKDESTFVKIEELKQELADLQQRGQFTGYEDARCSFETLSKDV
jgi:hypothetical protein